MIAAKYMERDEVDPKKELLGVGYKKKYSLV